MMRSLSSAVAGLRTHQTKMDVIGNNIANVNTYGYKANRAVFADVFYQNLNRGSSPVTTLGGTNPTQIGYGSLVATIDVLQQRSGASSTDRPMDVFIGGEGFFTLQDGAGNYLYTRLGSLGFDAVGNLVDGGGNFVMGFPQNADGTPNISADGTVTADELQPIQVNPDLLQELTDITISAGGEIIGILPGNTRITLGTARPTWAGIPSVPEDSNLQGQVNLKVGALPTAAEINAATGGRIPDPANPGSFINAPALTGLVTDVEYGELSIEAGTNMIITTSPDGRMTVQAHIVDNEGKKSTITAEGQWENGKVILKYEGDTLMTLTIADDPTFPDTSASRPAYPGYSYDPANQELTVPGSATPLELGSGFLIGADGMPTDIDGDPLPGFAPAQDPNVLPLADIPLFVDTSSTGTPNWVLNKAALSNGYTLNTGGLKYLLTTSDKGGNVRMTADAAGNEGPQTIPSVVNADGMYEVELGDAKFFFTPDMTNFMGNIGRIGMSEAEKVNIGCIAIAKFNNQSGLEQVGGTQYVTSLNTGEVTYNKPGTNNVGGLTANYLEQSNVDVAKEFTDMITTQRGFQANTRIVTVSDEMLNELVNLKR